MEYPEIRKLAEQMNSRKPKSHPCSFGNGECCKQTDVAVTLGDAQIIADAILDKRILKSVIEQTIKNASDPTSEYCPFFDLKKRICSIYQYRPVACIAYGIGGEMNSLNVCQGCYDCLKPSQRVTTQQDRIDSAIISNYLESVNKVDIRGFALHVLPKI